MFFTLHTPSDINHQAPCFLQEILTQKNNNFYRLPAMQLSTNNTITHPTAQTI